MLDASVAIENAPYALMASGTTVAAFASCSPGIGQNDSVAAVASCTNKSPVAAAASCSDV
jgi:hypothetical protein